MKLAEYKRGLNTVQTILARPDAALWSETVAVVHRLVLRGLLLAGVEAKDPTYERHLQLEGRASQGGCNFCRHPGSLMKCAG